MLKKLFSKISPDLWIFFIFLLCLGIEKKHVFAQAIPILSTGLIHNLLITYNPWKSIEIYLTDVIFLLVVIFWFIRVIWQKMRGASRAQTQLMPRPIKVALVFLGLFWPISVVSLWHNGFNFAEIFALIKLLEFGLLFLYVLINIDNFVKLLYTIGAFLSGVVLQALVGIAQYFAQQSCGLKWFGEPDLSPFIQNVAKIVVDGGRVLRAYGTLPHANVLGGYAVVGILLLLTLIVLIYTNNYFRWSHLFHVEQSNISFIVFPYVLVFISTFLALILTFSRSAWLGMGVAGMLFIALLWSNLRKIWTQSTIRERLPIYLALLAMVLIICAFYPQITAKVTQFEQNQDQALTGRVHYNQIAFNMTKKTPLLGVGYHNFVERMPQYSTVPLEWWQLQPAHNIYILALAEVGFFGLFCLIAAILTLVIFAIYRLRSRWHCLLTDAKIAFSGILSAVVALLIIGLFDHYLWDIQQGMLLFWLLIGLLAAIYHFEPTPDKWEQAFKLKR